MNIFKRKLEKTTPKELITDPITIFQSLFRNEGYSYLRGVQEEVLKTWNEKRQQRDVLCKMNTGSGKTLVSLLMLLSKMNEGVGPSLYLCPDRQLLQQAKKQADLYGIPICEINEDNCIPSAFLNSDSILLCTFQKLFNGRSIFEKNNIKIGAIVLDDAHVCVDIARDATTIKLPKGHDLFKRIMILFEEELKFQASGTLKRLKMGDPYASILKVPYWSWLQRHDELIELIGEYSDDDELFFKWGLIADELKSFNCYVGPKGIEISPIHVPYNSVRSFNEAKHRFILSATFEDQIDLIKDLGISKESVINAIIPNDRNDVGQRLVLAPQRFDYKITDGQIMELVNSYVHDGINVAVMVPSYERARRWEELGADIIDKFNINEKIDELKSKSGLFYVLVNRYDGVDLKGDMCRILVIDGYPSFSSYEQLYSEIRLESVKASLKAQIIEQGLGRAVRSGSDYCVVFLMGKDLLQFLGNTSNLKYFTPVTRTQLGLGLSLLDDEDNLDSVNTIKEIATLCLIQNSDWRKYHAEMISDIESDEYDERTIMNLEIANVEFSAMIKFKQRNYYEASSDIIEKILDKYQLDNRQKGWYFEQSAHYLYLDNITKSNDLQMKAAQISSHMLQSKNGRQFTKLVAKEPQILKALSFIKKFENSQDYIIHTENVLENLTLSPDIPFKKFERAMAEVGRIIGFQTEEPEAAFGNGPDILWNMTDNHFLVIEAKSMATHEEITRDNIGQLLQSGEWFKSNYGDLVNYNLVTIQSPKVKGWNVNPSQDTKVIDKESLGDFKKAIKTFVQGVNSSGFTSISNKEMTNLLGYLNLTPSGFRKTFLKNIVSKKR